MRKVRLTFFGFALVAVLFGFTPVGDKTVTVIKHGNETEYRIHLKKVTDSLSVNLADFASDFEFVRLETKNECLIDWGHYYVGEKYILAEISKKGILQFERNGKFVRTLILIGPGPKEFIEAKWTVDEKNQILIMAVRGKQNYFLRFDLNSGKNLDDLKMALPGRSQGVTYLKENVLMVVPAGLNSKSKDFCYLYNQDLAGNLISTIPARNVPVLLWNDLKYSGQNGLYRFNIGLNDTVFSIVNNGLVPFMTFDFGEYNPPDNSHVGRQNVSIEMEANSWVLFDNHHITKMKDGSPSGPMEYYILDKKLGKVYHKGTVYFDPINKPMKFFDTNSFIFQSNGLIHQAFAAVNLMEQAKKAFADPGFTEPYRSKLKELVSHLTIEDNPVLLIGRYKGH